MGLLKEAANPVPAGRRSPIPIKGSEFEMEVDQVIMALGTSPNPLVFINANGLERSRHGTVVANQETGRTTMEGVWAGGDVVTGAATVISAMGAGKRAAAGFASPLPTGDRPAARPARPPHP